MASRHAYYDTSNLSPHMQMQNSVALHRIGNFLMLIFCVIITFVYVNQLEIASREYLSADAIITSVSGPQITSSGRYSSNKKYTYTYTCEFKDEYNVWHYCYLKETLEEEDDVPSYWYQEELTIYYESGVKDYDTIYDSRPEKPGMKEWFIPMGFWGIFLILVILYVRKRIAFENKYGPITTG